jgi:hypothetical protein
MVCTYVLVLKDTDLETSKHQGKAQLDPSPAKK